MSRYVSLEQFRKRFEVVLCDNLSAREPREEPTSREPREEPTSREPTSREELTAREPTKYFDPFAR